MPDGQFLCCLFLSIITVMDRLIVSVAQQVSDNTNAIGGNGANQCNELLHCENDMMAVHKRCTEQSRKTTAQACQLTQQFVDLNRLMDIRIVEFQKCILVDNSTSSSISTALISTATDPPTSQRECQTNLLDHKQLLVKPEMGCWRAVAVIRSHCQRIRQCCPSAKFCMKQLRSSQATKSLRAKHIEINKKTLECRNQMRKVLTERKGKADPEMAAQAKYHAVLIAQKETQMGVIKEKYFSKLIPLSHKANLQKPRKKPIYAVTPAKANFYQKTLVTPTPKPPTYQPAQVESAKVRKLKTFESDGQSGVTTQLTNFEGLLRNMEKKSINKKKTTVKFRQNTNLSQKSTLHSSKHTELVTDPTMKRDSLSPINSNRQQLRRSKKHFAERVFSDNNLFPSLLSSDKPKPPTDSQEVEGYQPEDKPPGIFQLEVESGVVPKIFIQPQSQAFALPSNLDINRLKVLAARPNHSWRQSNQRRRIAIAEQLLAQGRLNVLGKRVPLLKAHGVGTGKEKSLVGLSQELVSFSQPEVTTLRPGRRPWSTNKTHLSIRMRNLAAASSHRKSGNVKSGVKKVWGESPKKAVFGKNKAKEVPFKKSTTSSSPVTGTSPRFVTFSRLSKDGQELPQQRSYLQSLSFQMSAPTVVLVDKKEAMLAEKTAPAMLQSDNNPQITTPSVYIERTVALVKQWQTTAAPPTTTLHSLRNYEVTVLPPPIDFDSGISEWKKPLTISSDIRRKSNSTLLPLVDASAEGSQPARKPPGKQVYITLAVNTTAALPMKPNKIKSVIDTILARKQLQRILVPLGSGTAAGRVVGYRNKVLHARRKLTRLVDDSTGKRNSPGWPNAFKMSKKHRTAKDQLQPLAIGDQQNLFQRTTLGVNPSAEEDLLTTIAPRTEIRRAPTRLPAPPAIISDPDDDLLLVKHNLIVNLEKFLDERKDQAKQKLELRLEKDRLDVLRRPKSESDLRHHLTGYCEIYSTCVDQMKYAQKKCQQLPDGSVSGRLLPGLPKRRFGDCNAKLMGLYQRIDIVHLELEESVENCLVEKIATGAAITSESCPTEWPTLPAFYDDSNNCVQRVSLIQNHCKKLGRCCNSLNSCRQLADSSALARRLKLEEEKLKTKSAECQIQSYEEYRRLRALEQRTDQPQVQSLPEQQITQQHVQAQLNTEDSSRRKRF